MDTGATISVMRPGLIYVGQRQDTRMTLLDAGGKEKTVEGTTIVELEIGNFCTSHAIVIAAIQNDVIIGQDLMQKHDCIVDWKAATFNIAGSLVSMKVPGVRNENSSPCVVPANHIHCKDDMSTNRSWGAETMFPEPLQELCKEGNRHLEANDKERLRAMLCKYSDTFSLHPDDLGRTALVNHSIDVGSARPIKQSPRQIPLAKREEARQEVIKMQRQGIIEPSYGPWSSPTVLVRKKDGSTRFCVDYRRLNDVTKKDSHPLPRIDTILDSLAGAQWFSTLYLKSGYWQVALDPADREKSAFCLDGGLWQFTVMPFGLCNAPATFERLMERVMRGLVGKGVLIYLDDIIVYAPTVMGQLRLMEEVFNRLKTAGLKLNPSKCQLFCQETTFLGHVVSKDGIYTDPRKITDLETWPRPQTVSEVRSFLGFCTYYRRFVRHFSDLASPLYILTEKKRTFRWTEDCERAFLRLKERLTAAPILAYPLESEPFIIDTDASDNGIGAVLSQMQLGEERVIGYHSMIFDKTQRRYCVIRRELLAVVKGITHFRPYLYGRRFTLRTDHASLRWLLNFRDPEGQWARWLQRLQEYDFDIQHRPGKSHGNADGLSRRPCDCKPCVRLETPVATTDQPVPTEKVRQIIVHGVSLADAQKEDTDLSCIINWMETEPSRPEWRTVSAASPLVKAYWAEWDALQLIDGVLYRRWEHNNGRQQRLLPVLPKVLQEEAMQQLHDNPTSGHFGYKKTLLRVREKFYWHGCRQAIDNWCRRCNLCASRKGPHKRKHGPAQIYLSGAPMERVAIDILGPLPETEQGNRYLLVAMDYFTKWPEVYPLPNQEATTVARALIGASFAVPLEIHSDQGRNFESKVFAEMCRLMRIYKTRTTPGYPQSDGMVERFNRMLLISLAMYTSNHQRDWEEYLPYVLFAYRSAVHESTGESPSKMMLGRDVRVPVDLVIQRPGDDIPHDVPGYVQHLKDIMEEVNMEVRCNLGHSAARMRTYYDRKADDEVYQPGDAVWYYYPRVKKRFSPKLMRPWTGPYKVMSRIHDNTYRIQLSSRTRPRVVNRYHLWRCRGRLAEGWWGQPSTRGDEPDTPAEDAPESFDEDLGETSGDGQRPLQSTRRGRPIKRPQRYR